MSEKDCQPTDAAFDQLMKEYLGVVSDAKQLRAEVERLKAALREIEQRSGKSAVITQLARAALKEGT